MDKVQCAKSKYDGALFFCKQNSILQGMMASHVDDFLDCSSDYFMKHVVNHIITERFKMGKHEAINFRYIEVNVKKFDTRRTIHHNQFVEEIEEMKLDNKDLTKDRPLNNSEQKMFRRTVGQLNWLVTTSSPDLAFEVLAESTMLKHLNVAGALRVQILFP